jgi:SpoVK/Ycf46/Vps4 family AAA+-type ATPase
MDGLATHVEPRFGWDDLVLPVDALARLQELCARRRFRATVFDTWQLNASRGVREGVVALFVGQPGTGKSMATEVVARDLGYDVYRVDLSAVVSKYIGETEKNLEAIFHAAEQGEAVLVFDEADALFGKRSDVRDAHDRYANIEVAYLLQRVERYRGVVILTSNLNGNLDDAFLRRLDCVVEFPLPDEGERLCLWQRSFGSGAPLAGDVDLAALAREFKLAGGHIRNVAVSAAFLAAADGGAIALQHVVRAIRREYQKLGKLAAESEFRAFA